MKQGVAVLAALILTIGCAAGLGPNNLRCGIDGARTVADSSDGNTVGSDAQTLC